MNILKGKQLISANVLWWTRWNGNNIPILFGSVVKYVSSNECRCHQISQKLNICKDITLETIPYHVRYYSRDRFEKFCGFIKNKRRAFDNFNKRKELALSIYRTIDTINFQEFYEFLELPDTFYSWFVLLELHMWMIMCQILDNEVSSLKLRNDIIKMMWYDVEARCKNLGPVQRKILKIQLTELHQRLPATLLAYDEGLLSTDTVLASALWNKVFEKQCDDPIKIEVLIRYIRFQIDHLSTKELKDVSQLENLKDMWRPFSDHVKAVTAL